MIQVLFAKPEQGCNFALRKPSKKEGEKKMIIIKVKDGESIDRALRRYKKKFEKTGVLKEKRRRMYYSKPSVEKREMMKRARRRQEHYADENY